MTNRFIAVVGVFLTLLAWSAFKPVGADPDEAIHLIHAWCGDSGDSGRCPRAELNTEMQLVPLRIARGNSCSYALGDYWTNSSCQNLEDPNQLTEVILIEYGGYPGLIKRVQGWLIDDNPDASVFRMRVLSSAIASLSIGGSLLLSSRYRLKIWLFLSICATPLVISLVASVNPSSWATSSALGIGVLRLGVSRAQLMSSGKPYRFLLVTQVLFLIFVLWFSRQDMRLMVWLVAVSIVFLYVCQLILLRANVTVSTIGIPVLVIGLLVLARNTYLDLATMLRFPAPFGQGGLEGWGLFFSNLRVSPSYLVGILLGGSQGGYATALNPRLSALVMLLALLTLVITSQVQLVRKLDLIRAVTGISGLTITILLFHQLLNTSILGSPIQPRYFLPLLIVLIAELLRGFEISTKNSALAATSLLFAVSALIFTAHNMMRHISGVSFNPDSSLLDVWRLMTTNNDSTLWWQGVLPIPPGIFYLLLVVLQSRLYFAWVRSATELLNEIE